MEFQPQKPETSPAEKGELTEQDLQDRQDFEYLLSLLEKRTPPRPRTKSATDEYRIITFEQQKVPEGSVTSLFNDIIFDFDGVLYDSTSYAAYRAVQMMLERYADTQKIPLPTPEEIANTYEAPWQKYYERFGIFLTPLEEEDFREEFHQCQEQASREHSSSMALFPEVKGVLDKIKEAQELNPKLKIHVISAGREKHITDILTEGGIIKDFDQIHTECHDKTAEIQQIADAGETREKTVMIGDLPSDIKDTQRVQGVRTIAVARGEREKERLGTYLPDYIVKDLNDLFDLKSYSRKLREKD